jgi:3-oxoacyl-[acyl-carrier protein] reductase
MKEVLGLEGQQALVVGGGFGIGRETALLLARAGAKVAVADIDPERAAGVAHEIGGAAVVGDVATEAGAKAVVERAVEALGGLTRVANIVGLAKWGSFVETGPDHWQAQLQINLFQQMNVCHAAARQMIAQGRGGAIAMVASVSGVYGARNHAAYGVAKAGVLSLARTLADELGPHGIRVNTVSPDVTATPRLVALAPGPAEEVIGRMDALAAGEGVPLRRFGRPDEIAKPLLFLLSDLSSFMTGQNLVCDGGTMVRFPHGAGEAPKPDRT